MKLPVNAAHNIFATSIVAFDVTSTLVDGRAETIQEADRQIRGVIQPADDKTIVLLPDGAESDGAQILHTQAAVFAFDVSNDAETDRQTYVRRSGEVWKVWKTQNWALHIAGGINRYILSRYRDVDNTL